MAVVVAAAGWMVSSRAGAILGIGVIFLSVVLILTFNRSKLPVYSVCFAVLALVFVPPKAIGFGLIGLFLAPVLSSFLIFFSIKRSRLSVVRPKGLGVLVCLYLILLLTSAVNSGSDFYYLAVAAVAVSVFLGAAQLSYFEIMTVRRTIVFAAIASAILALYENAFRGVPIIGIYSASLGQNTLVEGVRSQATLGHPLVLGFFLTLGIITLLSGVHWNWLPTTLGVILMFAGIVASGSASAVVVALVAVAASFVLRVKAGMARSYVAVGLVVVGLVITRSSLLPSSFSEGLVGKLTGANAEHRTASLEAIPSLLSDQAIVNVLFGNGWGSARRLYDAGILKSDGFYAVDNQLVTLVVTGGIVSVVLFFSFLLFRVKETDSAGLVAVLCTIVMGFSFDIAEWAATVGVLMALLAVSKPVASVREMESFGRDGQLANQAN